ncbi:MAG: glycosyltransferase, partial [Thermoplasmata archaeon]|nr:glycosyltransferase [Thermoplasmata archaeon]
ELVEDGRTGLLVKAGDPEDLAEKLVAVLSSHDTAVSFGKAGRSRVEERFSMGRAIDGSEKVYRELLET